MGRIAALILVLHWMALAALDCRALPASDAAHPALSSGMRAAHPGALPRELPRVVGLEGDVAKSDTVEWPLQGDPDAVAPCVALAHRPGTAPLPGALADTPARPAAARLFDARAPPAALA